MSSSQRSTTLARELGFDLVLLGRAGFRRPWTAPLTYPLLLGRTAREVLHRRPRAVVVVVPPIVAALFVVPIARLAGATVAMDIHTGAFLDGRWRWSVPILQVLGRWTTVNIVTLHSLALRMGRAVKQTVVLPDPIPRLPPEHAKGTGPADSGRNQPTVVAIAGWGDDEPLRELALAARDQRWSLFITGKQRWHLNLPPNASLTGFLSGEEFARTLRSANVIVVLTTRPETLLSGAWEGLSLGKALVLSDTTALRSTFGEAAVYVHPRHDSIRAGVERALANQGGLELAARDLAKAYERKSAAVTARLRAKLLPGVSGP